MSGQKRFGRLRISLDPTQGESIADAQIAAFASFSLTMQMRTIAFELSVVN